MIRAFSTRHPAMAFIPDVRLICHWLLVTSFCPSAVQPLEMHGRSDKLTPTRVIRWSDDAYITHHYAAAAPNLRTATLEHSAHEQLDAACCCPFLSPSIVWLGGFHFTPSSMLGGFIPRWSGAQLRLLRFDPAIASALCYTAPPRRAAQYPAEWESTASPRRIYAAALCTA